MSASLIVVGAGLSGLFSAVLAARRQVDVRLIAEGRGSLSLSHGCIDLWRDGSLVFALPRLEPAHPLRVAGSAAFESALAEFLDLLRLAHLPYHASLDLPLRLPTATGSVHHTLAAPFSMATGSLDDSTPIHLGRIPALRDFSAGLAASGLRHRALSFPVPLDLPLPGEPAQRDVYPHELAARLDRPEFRQAVCESWTPRLTGVRRLGVPAVLGLEHPLAVVADMEARLGVSLFEIPTLPPSVPGLRLERALRRMAVEFGVEFVEGPSVRGEVDGRSRGRRVSGVLATTAGGPRAFRADAVVLATGGALHGGWLGFANGEAQEAVFGLPIETPTDRASWASPDMFEPHAFSRFGLRVDERMRPIDGKGRPYFENLHAVGGLLGGADRAREASRQGIDLATAWAAVNAILQ